MSGPVRLCSRCGKPISWLNKEPLCRACYLQRVGTCKDCGEKRRLRGLVCRTCGSHRLARNYLQRVSTILREQSPLANHLLHGYLQYLESHYGNQPRPIYYALWPVVNLMKDGHLAPSMSWAEVNTMRTQARTGRQRAALRRYLEFMTAQGLGPSFQDAQWEARLGRLLDSYPPAFQKEIVRYRQFLGTTRKLQRWTIYLALVHLRRFFKWAGESAHVPGIRAVAGHLVRAYLAGRQQRLSQRSWAKDARVIRDFYKWAKNECLVFVDPTLGLKIGQPDTLMVGLPIEQQRLLSAHWLHPEADPLEAAAGLLALAHGLSPAELVGLRVSDFDATAKRINLPSRQLGLRLSSAVALVLCRYLDYRRRIDHGSGNPYFFVNRLSIRQGTPVGPNYLTGYLHKRSLGKIESTLQLRISYLVDVAATGRIKVLEYLGLTHSGSRHYLASTMGGLIGRQLVGPSYSPRE